MKEHFVQQMLTNPEGGHLYYLLETKAGRLECLKILKEDLHLLAGYVHVPHPPETKITMPRFKEV